MSPTAEQLASFYRVSRELTSRFRCLIRLVDELPNDDICVVAVPDSMELGQRLIIYIDPSGEVRYV